MKKDSLKSIIVLGAICLVVAILLSGVNMITAPLIEAAERQAADGALLEVLPDATEFEAIEGDFPETVTEMKKDLGGSGFAFKITATSSYSQSPMSMVLGIDNNGKITKLVFVNYAETKGTAGDFEPLFVGKDATLSDVVAGVTYTTNAIKASLKDAYDVFYEYADIEKSDEQKLQDLYSKVLPEGTDKTGAYTLTKLDIAGCAPASITGVYAPATGVGYIVTALSGETTVVMGINAYGAVNAIYDLEGNDLAGKAEYDQLKADAVAAAPSIYQTNNATTLDKMVAAGIIANASSAKQVDFSAVSSRVVAVYDVGNGTAYVAKAEGYGGVLEVCYVIDADGNIVKYATLEQHEESLEEYGQKFGTVIAEADYASRFDGKTTETVNDDTILIAQSTFTSNAAKACWNSIKAAHETLMGGVN